MAQIFRLFSGWASADPPMPSHDFGGQRWHDTPPLAMVSGKPSANRLERARDQVLFDRNQLIEAVAEELRLKPSRERKPFVDRADDTLVLTVRRALRDPQEQPSGRVRLGSVIFGLSNDALLRSARAKCESQYLLVPVIKVPEAGLGHDRHPEAVVAHGVDQSFARQTMERIPHRGDARVQLIGDRGRLEWLTGIEASGKKLALQRRVDPVVGRAPAHGAGSPEHPPAPTGGGVKPRKYRRAIHSNPTTLRHAMVPSDAASGHSKKRGG